MKPKTRQLWDKQDRHPGDRWRLFRSIADAYHPKKILYPGSYVDVAPSFVFPDVTYVDVDQRAAAFFEDVEGVQKIIKDHDTSPGNPSFRFIHADYTDLNLPSERFDLLISLYAGFISEYCTGFLKVGGRLLANPSHGDAALASIDPRYELTGVVVSRSGDYQVSEENLSSYLIPKKSTKVTRDTLFKTCRGIAYTRSPFAYVFTRTT